jgi:hypothetical protein
MGASVALAFLRGHREAWIGLFVALAVTALVALRQRGSRATPGRVLLLSAMVSVLAAFGILLAMALAVPRVTWRRVPTPAFAVPAGESWRSLRSLAAPVLDAGRPEIALPGLDAAGRVRLHGLFSGAPLPDYPEAPADPPVPGSARICRFEAEECRAWPRAWPEPAAPPESAFVWTREISAGALAYDAESGVFLHHVEGLRPAGPAVAMAGTATPVSPPNGRSTEGTWGIEQVGKLTSQPSHDGPTALFVVRRIAGDRLDAVRVVALPAGESFTYSVERATVSLTAGPAALAWFARPLLLTLVLWFPLVTLLLQAAPALWASRRRKQLEAGAPVSELPAVADASELAARARLSMAQRLHGLALLAVGLAVTAPAVVAAVGLVASR